MFTQNLKADKSVTKIRLEKKKKWTNKGNDTLDGADSTLYKTTCHIRCLYENSQGGKKNFGEKEKWTD